MKYLYKHPPHRNIIPRFDYRPVWYLMQERFYFQYRRRRSYPIEYSKVKITKMNLLDYFFFNELTAVTKSSIFSNARNCRI